MLKQQIPAVLARSNLCGVEVQTKTLLPLLLDSLCFYTGHDEDLGECQNVFKFRPT
jgi:hypothetical protein